MKDENIYERLIIVLSAILIVIVAGVAISGSL